MKTETAHIPLRLYIDPVNNQWWISRGEKQWCPNLEHLFQPAVPPLLTRQCHATMDGLLTNLSSILAIYPSPREIPPFNFATIWKEGDDNCVQAKRPGFRGGHGQSDNHSDECATKRHCEIDFFLRKKRSGEGRVSYDAVLFCPKQRSIGSTFGNRSSLF